MKMNTHIIITPVYTDVNCKLMQLGSKESFIVSTSLGSSIVKAFRKIINTSVID